MSDFDQMTLDLLEQSRAQTQNLIDIFGVDIALYRTAYVDDGAGGTKPSGPAAPEAAVRRYFKPATDMPTVMRNSDGRTYDYVLIGLWDDDIRDEDYFIIDGRRYEIDHVYEDTSYQVKAAVKVHGG